MDHNSRYFSWPAESDEYFDTHFVNLTLIFKILVFLSALWEAIHLDLPLFLHMSWVFFNREKSIFSEKKGIFSIPLHDTGSKIRNSDPQWKITYSFIKTTLIVLMEDLSLFFPGPVSKHRKWGQTTALRIWIFKVILTIVNFTTSKFEFNSSIILIEWI